ncbi:MAG: PEP-CTERM sorting domain-containing protein [Candidatus Omnitrophica bacterium]|nr:PEP-CTERM sorting domain-containing protein [Candidatus Omnitrophota bacterium]
MKHLAVGLCLVVLASLCAAPAGATLIGDTVTITESFNGVANVFNAPIDVMVGSGFELEPWAGFNIDIGSESIFMDYAGEITQPSSVDYDGLVEIEFTDLDWVGHPGRIVNVSVSFADWSINPTVTFTDDSVKVAFATDTIIETSDAFVQVDLIVEHQEIPEPTTMALLGMGAAGLIAKRRRVV